jgi:hypothetical protein
MADDGIKHFGLGALLGGAVAYWLRGMQERAERAGRAVGADVYGTEGTSTFEGTVTPAEVVAERAERAGRATGGRVYGAETLSDS